MRVWLLLLLVGCDNRTSALINIEGARPVVSLQLTVTLPGRELVRPLGALSPPRSLLLLLPDADQGVDLSLAGVEESGRDVNAQAHFESKPHQQITITMSLAGPGDDLSMPVDLTGADLTGYVEDLANADLAPSGDLAGADFSNVPSLSVVAGLPGANNSFDGTGRDARLSVPQQAVLVGTSLYTFELFSGHLRKIDVTSGVVTTVPLINASDSQPFRASNAVGLVSDGLGHLFVSDENDDTIRKINLADNKVSILIGVPNTPGSTDSPPLLHTPLGMAFDANGDLWVADAGNDTIRKIVLAGPTVTTPLGAVGVSDFQDGSGSGGHFQNPKGLAFYNGDLYITDSGTLRKAVVSASPAPLTTILPEGSWSDATGVASAGGGVFYVVDEGLNNLREVTLGPPAVDVLAAGKATFTQDMIDGIGGAARFVDPRWIVLDGAGAGYITEGGAVRKIDLGTLNVTTLAGMSPNADSTDSPRARFDSPSGVAFDGNDTLYVADYASNRIRKLTLSTGNLTTFAGSGAYSSVDGQGTAASFYSPINVIRDPAGNLYVSDFQSHCVRMISPGGDVKTIAGLANSPGMPSPSPVPGTQARFSNPDGLAFDGNHTLWVADSGTNVLRAIDLSNTSYLTSWVAGSGANGHGNGIGRAAAFNSPEGLAYDAAQHLLYLADAGEGLIRRIDMTNPAMPDVQTLTGKSFIGVPADGAFADATFGDFGELAFDSSRNVLWVTDHSSDLIRRLDLTAQTVTSPVGTPNALLTKPGPLPAFIAAPWGVVLTPKGLVLTSQDENTVLLATGL